jgi:hypothetical protein
MLLFSLFDFRYQDPRDTQGDNESNKNRLHDFDASSACNNASHSGEKRAARLSEDKDKSQGCWLQVLWEELRTDGHTLT